MFLAATSTKFNQRNVKQTGGGLVTYHHIHKSGSQKSRHKSKFYARGGERQSKSNTNKSRLQDAESRRLTDRCLRFGLRMQGTIIALGRSIVVVPCRAFAVGGGERVVARPLLVLAHPDGDHRGHGTWLNAH